jgi:hypothetical protein
VVGRDPLPTWLGLVLWTPAPATEDDAPMPPTELEGGVVTTFGGCETGSDFRLAFAALGFLCEACVRVLCEGRVLCRASVRGGDGAGGVSTGVSATVAGAGAATALAPASRLPPLVVRELAARVDAAASVGTARATATPRLDGV